MTHGTGGGGRASGIAGLLLLIITATGAGGCATTIAPPPHPFDPVPVFITDYGRHSSVLLPHPNGGFTEYAFGDWNWFALKRTTSGDALEALFFSPASTLGRRELAIDDDVNAITTATRAAHVARIEVPRERAEALRRELEAIYERRMDTVTYQPYSDLWFVKTTGPYNLFHNCNHVTAAWLRELGCQVHGAAMFSNFKVKTAK
jgi:hypothetical protein